MPSPAVPPQGGRRRRAARPMPALRPAIDAAVVAAFGLDRASLRHPSRGEARTAFARQIAMYVAHVGAGLTMTEVGRMFERDRTTVAHACRLVEDRRDDPRIGTIVDSVEAALAAWRALADAARGEAA